MSITYSQTGQLHQETETRLAAPTLAARRAPSTAPQLCAVIIEPRQLIRDCLAKALRSVSGYDVIAVPTIEEWLNISERTPAHILFLSSPDRIGNEQFYNNVQRLSQVRSHIPTVVLSDTEDMSDVLNAINKGAKGYISTNLSLDILVEAMRLIRAGGVFVPATCLKSGRDAGAGRAAKALWSDVFTVRQTAVVEALRQGKANKTIAYELQLQESTVKVHIRNIMKKLKAKNRTEVAYLVTKLQNQN